MRRALGLAPPPTLALVLALALALAGCTTTDPETGEPSQLETPSTAATQAQLAAAVAQIPDAVAVDAEVLRGSQQLLTMEGSFDNASGVTYLGLKADAQTLAAMSGGQVSADLLGDDVVLYSTKEGSLFLRGSTGLVFSGAGRGSAFDPGTGLRAAPLGKILEGGGFVRGLLQDAQVRSVKSVQHQGVDALEVVADVQTPTRNATVAAILVPATNRIVHLETTLAADPDAPGDPLAGATLLADIQYAPRAAPERALRAMSLVHASSASILEFAPSEVVWTFSGAPRVAVADAVVLARTSNFDLLSGDPQGEPLWTYALAEGAKERDGVRIEFSDADGDGKVGAGDTLRAAATGDQGVPALLLKDGASGVALLAISG